jgi:2-dehydropantoate 2-reductase
MRIAVMGAGAVGSYFGARLAKAGLDVVLIGRGPHLTRMRRDSLRVRSIDGDFDIIMKTATDPEEVGPCDLVLFTVKSYDTAEAARKIAPLLGHQTPVLSLQNGLGNEETIEEMIGGGRVLHGLCYIGARIDVPGEVIHSAAGRVILGETDGRKTIRAVRVESAFADAGIAVKVSSEIIAEQWKKLLWNLSFNAISALTRATVGQLLAVQECAKIAKDAMEEALAVAKAEGVQLPADLVFRVLESNDQFRDLRTSMLQDVERGGRLEFEAINGAVVRRGKHIRVATPSNEVLYGLLKCLDRVLAEERKISAEIARR